VGAGAGTAQAAKTKAAAISMIKVILKLFMTLCLLGASVNGW
jgi:hypothetical protein